jgi:hypothetical protein
MEQYNLSFEEAIKECLANRGFIQGDDFKKGVFVKIEEGTLVVVERSNSSYNKICNFHISTGTVSQKYKLFAVANDKELGLK